MRMAPSGLGPHWRVGATSVAVRRQAVRTFLSNVLRYYRVVSCSSHIL